MMKKLYKLATIFAKQIRAHDHEFVESYDEERYNNNLEHAINIYYDDIKFLSYEELKDEKRKVIMEIEEVLNNLAEKDEDYEKDLADVPKFLREKLKTIKLVQQYFHPQYS